MLVAAVLAGCGSQPPRPGAAALVGHDKISEASVQARVADFRAQASRLPGNGPYQDPAGLVSMTVNGMVFSDLVDHALADHQLSVTPGEVAQLRADETQAAGGEDALERMLLLKYAVPAQDIDAYFREQVGLQKLAALGGQQVATIEGNRTVNQFLTQAATELKVTVNPRYGRWDDQQSVLDQPGEDWLPQSGAAS
ncbi:hypothetical protein [Kitasatospora sp. LaBMicrA B282]|uniref:hypothetical protein n=1 Tax=Kitasatospora sp. LaBMicrA B282 TaxID=3420949 RepID=UPI003D0C6253